MFGYIVLDKSKIKQEEYILFNAFYCSVCKTIGKRYNQILRFSTNYDITFFAIFIFDQLNYDVELNLERCIGNPIKKKPIIKGNDLMQRIADLNIIFSYYKVQDDVFDGKKMNLVQRIIKKHYLRARERERELDEIVKTHYEALRESERNNESSIDIVSHHFASLLRECASIFLQEKKNDNSLNLMYNIGKFVYLADALDDIDEDNKKKTYNPFLSLFCNYENRTQFIGENKSQLETIFAFTVNRVIECFNAISFNQSYSLIENIVYYGLRKKTQELFESKKKLSKPKL